MLYRRFRRLFGRQALAPKRMTLRIVVLLVLAATLVPFALRSIQILSADAAGLAVGVALALWGASRTRFLTDNGRLYYIPHTYTGIAVSALFIGRLAYRIVQMYAPSAGATGLGSPDASFGPAGGPQATLATPLTGAIFFVLIGYYVCYYGLVLWKSKHITPETLETPAAPSGST
jgi:hypothetical protein